MAEGWICLHRKIQECVIWEVDEKFDYRSAWIDLLLLANHEDKKIVFDGKPIVVKRGQRITSVRKLAERWQWGIERTTRFLRMLENEKMITKESDKRRTLLTIVNYGVYNDMRNTDRYSNGTLTDTVPEHQPDTNNNDNNDNNDNKNTEESSLRSDSSCGEPSESATPPKPSEVVFIKIPLIDKTDFDVTEKMVTEYKELYPAVDVEQALRNMRGWCLEKAAQRKTRQGVTRFIGRWLRKEQERAGSKNQTALSNQEKNLQMIAEYQKMLEEEGE